MDLPKPSNPKICIIGAGPNGIMACKHLKDIGDVTVYESKSDIGGLWLYTDENERTYPNLEQNEFYKLYGCLHSSIYQGLTTDIPKQFMTYKDFPFDDDLPCMLSVHQYWEYLKSYCEHFSLENHIKFNTTVTSVKVDENSERRYCVKTTNTEGDKEEKTEHFDYVLVVNGHYSLYTIPDFEGIETFEGEQFHSHLFRKFEPEYFSNKNVLIVGSRNSAYDILDMIFLKEGAFEETNIKKVFVTARTTETLEKSSKYVPYKEAGTLELKLGNVKKITPNTVQFGDGSEEEIDTIIYCTGYQYCFPFFDPKDKILEFDNGLNRGK